MKRRILIIAPLILLGLLIGWRLVEKRADIVSQANQRTARMKAPPSVVLGVARVRDVTHTFEAVGTVDSPQNVKIAPKVTGRIDYLTLHEGDRVSKGQVLVRIDPSQVEANVQQAMASLAEVQYRLAQAQITQNPTNVSVNTQIRQQKAGVSSAVADYNQVRQNYQAQLAASSAGVTDAKSRIENAKAGIAGAQANLDNANVKYRRILDLYKQGFVAAQDVDDAKAAVSVQQANLDIARGQLKSAQAQKDSADQQASIVKTKGLADIAASKARLAQAGASLDYAKANIAQKPAYVQSIAALNSAKAQRADTILISPLDGFVTSRYVDPGSMATPGQPILAVQYMKQVWVTVNVPEEVSANVHIGEPSKVIFDALPGQTFVGSVIQLNPSADPQSRQFMARVLLNNAQGLFKPGMFAHVSIETERVRNAIVVPREAVQRDKFGSYVMLIDSRSRAKREPVVTSIDDPNFIAVENGVRPGDKVITMSAFPIRDGQTVRVPQPRRGGSRGPK